MPSKIASAHHTLADWDFEKGAQYRSLSADEFVSPPTSLKFSGSPGHWNGSVLCRIPDTLVLPQGEVRTWHHSNQSAVILCLFRNQAVLGTSTWRDCYYIALINDLAYLYRAVNYGITLRDSTAYPTLFDQWVHSRAFFYNGKTPGEVPALCVDLYREVAGEWIKEGDTLYDTANSWKDSARNRCGIWPTLTVGQILYLDDTEIWGPV